MAAEPQPPGPPQPPQPQSWDRWPYGWDAGGTQDAYGAYSPWATPSWNEPPPPPHERGFRRWFIAVMLLVVVVIGAVVGVGVSVWRGVENPVATTSGPGSVSGSVEVVERAVVDVTSRLADGSGIAAGTGMIISSSGEVLTNNHVVRDGAHITAQVDGAGPDIPATVVGVDAVHDVALLQLQGVSGLPMVSFADSASLHVGDGVTTLGNALGQGGQPVSSSGDVTALGQTITVSDEIGGSETLNNLIEINAQILQGDSGGPLLNSSGQVVGMDTAAEVLGVGRDPASIAGYAIPSNDALSVVKQIQHGGGGTVQPGNVAVLGVEVVGNGTSHGVPVSGVQPQSPADQAGIAAGDVITSIDGKSVTSPSDLRTAIQGHKVGDQVRVGWTDADGASHTATVPLAAGPPA